MNEIVRRITTGMGDRALFIGGIAVETYAPYRRTHDVDVVVRERDFVSLKSVLARLGLAHRRSPHLEKHTFKSRDAGEVDAYTTRIGNVPVEEALFRRGRTLPFADFEVRAVSLEDLLHLKIAAGREMDLTDVAVLLLERGEEVEAGVLEALVGLSALRRALGAAVDQVPAEYGWQAKRKLKARLRERGWL